MTRHAATLFYSSDPANLTAVYTFTGALSVRHHDVRGGWDRLDQPPGRPPTENNCSCFSDDDTDCYCEYGNDWIRFANLVLKAAGYVPTGEWYRRDTGHFSKAYAVEVREELTRAEVQRLAELDDEREDERQRSDGIMDPYAAKRRSIERRAIYKAANDRNRNVAASN